MPQYPNVCALARAERSEFVALLQDLTPQQWDAASLCRDWTVRDVVAHTVSYLSQSRIELIANMIRARWDIDRLNACGLAKHADTSPEELVRQMRAGIEPSGAAALYRGRVALIECLIHQQDIRRPLGLPRVIPADRLRAALSYARISPVIGGARRTRGLRLIATDTDWSAGVGTELRGPGEALLLAMTGRAAAVADELTGPGRSELRRRD